MKKLILLIEFVIVSLIGIAQEVAEYDDYYIYNSLIFSEKGAKIPLFDGVLFYYDNSVDSTGLYFFDGNRFYGLTPNDSLDYYVSRIELNDSLGYYVSRAELVDTLLRYADTSWVLDEIQDISYWIKIPGGIAYDNNVVVGDSLKLFGNKIHQNITNVQSGLTQESTFLDDTFKINSNITETTILYSDRKKSYLDTTTGGWTHSGNIYYWPYLRNSETSSDVYNYYGMYYTTKTSKNVYGFLEGFSNFPTVDIGTSNPSDSIVVQNFYSNYTNSAIISRGKSVYVPEFIGYYNYIRGGLGTNAGRFWSDNFYGNKTEFKNDVNFDLNYHINNFYADYIGGDFDAENNAENAWGYYEDNLAPNYFGSETTIQDNLLILDESGSDTLLIFDDGDTTRIISDNIIKIEKTGVSLDTLYLGNGKVHDITAGDTLATTAYTDAKVEGLVSFGTVEQIPVTNTSGKDFDYFTNFKFDGARLTLGSGIAGENILAGYYAGNALTTGDYNHLFGVQTGRYITTGTRNHAFGNNCISSAGATDADYNTAIGDSALSSVTGDWNTGLGYLAGQSITSGDRNLMIGSYAGRNITTTDYNIFIGNQAGFNATGSGGVTVVGNQAGYSNIGVNSVFIGNQAGYSNTIGNYNTFIGNLAGYSNLAAANNVYIGHKAGYAATQANNVAIGYEAGYNMTDAGAINIGYQAGKLSQNQENLFIGYQAGTSAASGSAFNVAIGYRTGWKLISGSLNNTFLGNHAGEQRTTGDDNVAIGYRALEDGTTTSSNIGIGTQAGLQNNGDRNVFIGTQAGENNIGSGNIFIGYQAGINEIGSNKLHIANLSTLPSLIYGEFDNKILKFNADTIYNRGYLQADSGSFQVHSAKYGKVQPADITLANTWLPLKIDTIYENLTTEGFQLTNDSIGVIIGFDGVIKIDGQASLKNNGTGNVNASTFFRLLKNNVEQADFNIARNRNYASGGADVLGQNGNMLNVSVGDTISAQLKVTNTDIDLEGLDGSYFDTPSVPGVINIIQILKK